MAQEKTPAVNAPFMLGNALPDMQKLMMVAPHMQAALMKAAIDQQRELFAFLERRCSEDMKLADKIGSATSVSDVYSACLGFYTDAATQYAAEASKAAEIGSQSAIEVAHDIQQQQSEAMAAVRKPETEAA